MVTVVDAASLLRDYGSHDLLRDRGEVAGEGDERTLVDLLVDQIEFADVVVINKASSAGAEALRSVRAVVRGLNADAKVIEADFGRVPLGAVLGTGLFDFDRAHRHPTWLRELLGFRDHVPETEEYGIRSFVYRARRPFDPARLDATLKRPWPGLIRAKGVFWLATRPAWVGSLSLAGAVMRIEGMGRWWAATPRERWPEDDALRDRIRAAWAPGWGDRRQELVFIGQGLDEAALRPALDGCLMGSEDPSLFDPARHRALPDPFPAWETADAA